MKKSQGISITVIIIAVLGLLVLVTLAILFGGKILNFGSKTSEIENSVGSVDSAKCVLKCQRFNAFCIKSVEDTNNNVHYYIYDQGDCSQLYNYLTQNCKGVVSFGASASGAKKSDIVSRDQASGLPTSRADVECHS